MVAFTPTPETITLAHMMVAAVIAIASTFGTWVFLQKSTHDRQSLADQAKKGKAGLTHSYSEIHMMIRQALQKEKRDASEVKGLQRGDILP